VSAGCWLGNQLFFIKLLLVLNTNVFFLGDKVFGKSAGFELSSESSGLFEFWGVMFSDANKKQNFELLLILWRAHDLLF
jgi:hypothetical protein